MSTEATLHIPCHASLLEVAKSVPLTPKQALAFTAPHFGRQTTTPLILQGETSHAVDNWKAVAVIDGTGYYGEGENAVMALRRALAKVEGFDVEEDMVSD